MNFLDGYTLFILFIYYFLKYIDMEKYSFGNKVLDYYRHWYEFGIFYVLKFVIFSRKLPNVR